MLHCLHLCDTASWTRLRWISLLSSCLVLIPTYVANIWDENSAFNKIEMLLTDCADHTSYTVLPVPTYSLQYWNCSFPQFIPGSFYLYFHSLVHFWSRAKYCRPYLSPISFVLRYRRTNFVKFKIRTDSYVRYKNRKFVELLRKN